MSAEPMIDRSMPIDRLPQFLTIPEVMSYLGIGRSSAYQLARERGIKFGRLVRVPREALTALTNGKRNQS